MQIIIFNMKFYSPLWNQLLNIFLQDVTMENYIKLLMEHKVSHLVCATDQAYKTDDLAKSGSLFFAHRA